VTPRAENPLHPRHGHHQPLIASGADALIGLIGAQRLAAALAERKGIDPDQLRALSRSVILA
jgi:glucosamine 6-phosphate synthetase-like amidotransferase/phosphosugar isomerase protein